MNIFTYVRSHLSILTVINEYTTLKKLGTYWKGHCPFHNERTGSFTVSPHKEIYYCFGCHQGGDVIDFIAHIENISQKEAAQQLIERYQIKVPATLWAEKEHHELQHKKRYEHLCKTIAQWCHQQLLMNNQGLHYLEKRGITHTSIQHFMLGILPSQGASFKSLLEWCKKEGFLLGDLLHIHFLVEGKTLYSPFENRLIIPIADHLGNQCGFGGRSHLVDDQRPKYYNSHDHEFFNKGTILFGLDKAKKAIQQEQRVFVVEGYFDCITMHQAGYANTVATLGTACTLEHLTLLTRYAEKIIIVYDADSAGQKAILRLAQLCWQVDLELGVMSLPEGEDPASYLARFGTLGSLIEQAEDIFTFCLMRMGKDFIHKSLQERLHRIHYFLKLLIPLKQPLKQDLLLQRASDVFKIPFESLKNEFLSFSHKEVPKTSPSPLSVQDIKEEEEKITILEKKIFFAILRSEEWPLNEDLEFLAYTFTPPLVSIVQKLIHFKKNHEKFAWADFCGTLLKTEKILMSKYIVEAEGFPPDSFNTLFVQYFKKQWKIAVSNVKMKLIEAQKTNVDPHTIKSILSDFQHLKEKLLRKGLL